MAALSSVAAAAAGRSEAGNGYERGGESGAAEQLLSGQVVGHWLSSSGRSTTKVASGSKPTVIESPLRSPGASSPMFWT